MKAAEIPGAVLGGIRTGDGTGVATIAAANREETESPEGIAIDRPDPTAIERIAAIGPTARIERNAAIEPTARIGRNGAIELNTRIEPVAAIELTAQIGATVLQLPLGRPSRPWSVNSERSAISCSEPSSEWDSARSRFPKARTGR